MTNFNISIAFPFIKSKIGERYCQNTKPPLATTSGKRPPHVGDLIFSKHQTFSGKITENGN